jgi:hypothetical protein
MKRFKSRWIISVSIPVTGDVYVRREDGVFCPTTSGILTGPSASRPFVPLQKRRISILTRTSRRVLVCFCRLDL